MMSFAAIEPEMWEIAPVAAMNTIPTFVLLYQVSHLEW